MKHDTNDQPSKHDSFSGMPSTLPKPRLASGILAVVVGAIAIGAFYVWNVSPRIHAGKAIAETAKDTRSTVVVVPVTRGKANVDLILPSTMQPIQEAPIYARTNGYVRHWHVDIGDTVKTGQLLAEIDTPEVDRELKQAGANVQQVKANLALAKTTAERWQSLLKENAVSHQEVDEKTSAYEARRADLAAVEANVQRLRELKQFQRVVAPFAGTITGRQIEVGQLIASNSVDPNRWLYKLARLDKLRTYVNVPQSHIRLVRTDAPVTILLREFPGKQFQGKVARTAVALDPQSKTLQTEVQIPNETGELAAGMYAQVKFELKQEAPTLMVPANTLIVRADGPQVAAVENSVVHMRKISLGRDFGTQIEVLSGVNDQELIVTNPTDSMRDGVSVKTVMAPPPEKPAEKAAEKPADKPAAANKGTTPPADSPVGEKPIEKAGEKPAVKPGDKAENATDKVAKQSAEKK
jgi:RND family efflux transporter MFP subunit